MAAAASSDELNMIWSHEISEENMLGSFFLDDAVTDMSMIQTIRLDPKAQMTHFIKYQTVFSLIKKIKLHASPDEIEKMIKTYKEDISINAWIKTHKIIYEEAKVYLKYNSFVSEIMRFIVIPICFKSHYVLAIINRYDDRYSVVYDSLLEGTRFVQNYDTELNMIIKLMEKFIIAMEIIEKESDMIKQLDMKCPEPFTKPEDEDYVISRGFGIKQEYMSCGLFVYTGMYQWAIKKNIEINSLDEDLFSKPGMILSSNEYVAMILANIIFHRLLVYLKINSIRSECEIILCNASLFKEDKTLTSQIERYISLVITRRKFMKHCPEITMKQIDDTSLLNFKHMTRRVFIMIGSRDPSLGIIEYQKKEAIKSLMDSSIIRLMVYPGQCIEVFEKQGRTSQDDSLKTHNRNVIDKFYSFGLSKLNYAVPIQTSYMKRTNDKEPKWSNEWVDHKERIICIPIPTLESTRIIPVINYGFLAIQEVEKI